MMFPTFYWQRVKLVTLFAIICLAFDTPLAGVSYLILGTLLPRL